MRLLSPEAPRIEIKKPVVRKSRRFLRDYARLSNACHKWTVYLALAVNSPNLLGDFDLFARFLQEDYSMRSVREVRRCIFRFVAANENKVAFLNVGRSFVRSFILSARWLARMEALLSTSFPDSDPATSIQWTWCGTSRKRRSGGTARRLFRSRRSWPAGPVQWCQVVARRSDSVIHTN